jgi:uncharacterized coiled-coil DUF342 family protein
MEKTQTQPTTNGSHDLMLQQQLSTMMQERDQAREQLAEEKKLTKHLTAQSSKFSNRIAALQEELEETRSEIELVGVSTDSVLETMRGRLETVEIALRLIATRQQIRPQFSDTLTILADILERTRHGIDESQAEYELTEETHA